MIALGLPVLVGLMGRHFLYTTSKFRKLFNREAVTYGPKDIWFSPSGDQLWLASGDGLFSQGLFLRKLMIKGDLDGWSSSKKDCSEDKWLSSVKYHLENGWLWVNLFSFYGYHIKKGSG